MERLLSTLVALVFVISAKAQIPEDIFNNRRIDSLGLEKVPCFPGGFDKIDIYFKNNLRYPKRALQNHIEGTVEVTFIVEKDGSLTNIKLRRNVSPEIDKEALRLVRNSPKWSPAIQKGQPIRFGAYVPIVFKLN